MRYPTQELNRLKESLPLTLIFRMTLTCAFLGCLMLATALVSVKFGGKYTIIYHPDTFRILISLLLAAVVGSSLPARVDRIDYLIIWILVIFSGLPLLIPYALGGNSAEWMFVGVSFWVLLAVQMRLTFRATVKQPKLRGGWWLLAIFFGTVAAYSVFTAIFWVGLTPTFDFSKIYEVRETYLAMNIPFGNRLYKWTAFIIAPLAFFLGISRGSVILVILGIAIAMILYFATGHKTYLFVIPFTYMVYWVWRQRRPAFWMISGLSCILLVGIGTYYISDNTRLNATFSNRLYVIPAKISYEYHDYFSSHPKVMLSHSVFSGVFDYPYDEDPARIISEVYYNNPDGYPNTGIVGDAYMNFGYSGLVLLFILVSAILRLITWLAVDKNQLLVLAITLMPIFTWVNSGFMTSFFTSGLAFGILGLWMLPNERIEQKQKKYNYE